MALGLEAHILRFTFECSIIHLSEYKKYKEFETETQLIGGYTTTSSYRIIWIGSKYRPLNTKVTGELYNKKIETIKELVVKSLQYKWGINGDDSNILDIVLKHTLMCIPELFAMDAMIDTRAYALTTIIDSIVLMGNYNNIQTNYIRIPVRFRQLHRGTCWAASTMNALFLLKSMGVKIQEKYTRHPGGETKTWDYFCETLDVNLYASMVIIKQKGVELDIGAGYHPFFIWHNSNNFSIDELNPGIVTFVAGIYDDAASLVLKVVFNRFIRIRSDADILNANIEALSDIIMKEMQENEVRLVSFTGRSLFSGHVIAVHKKMNGYFEIHDSNHMFAYTSVETYLGIECDPIRPISYITSVYVRYTPKI